MYLTINMFRRVEKVEEDCEVQSLPNLSFHAAAPEDSEGSDQDRLSEELISSF